MTMTTVGYGDIVPINPIEYIFCIIIMVFFFSSIFLVVFMWLFCLYIE